MKKLRCAVIGVGYLGKFHAEKYANLPQADLVAVCDTDINRAKTVANEVNAQAVADYQELLGQVDAVSVATPTLSHYRIAKKFLESG